MFILSTYIHNIQHAIYVMYVCMYVCIYVYVCVDVYMLVYVSRGSSGPRPRRRRPSGVLMGGVCGVDALQCLGGQMRGQNNKLMFKLKMRSLLFMSE